MALRGFWWLISKVFGLESIVRQRVMVFFRGGYRGTLSCMREHPAKAPIKSLRDAYKVPGFHVRAKLDSSEHQPPAFVLTLDRRSKKWCAANAENRAAAFMTIAGDGCVIWRAETEKSISIFRCAA